MIYVMFLLTKRSFFASVINKFIVMLNGFGT